MEGLEGAIKHATRKAELGKGAPRVVPANRRSAASKGLIS